MPLWAYQSVYPWSHTDGTLTEQARLWLNTLFRTVSTTGSGGGVELGGDIGGTNASPKVIGIEGRPVIATAPTDGQVLTWVNADGKWEPQTPLPSGGTTAVREVPSGTLNGANTSFTLSFTPSPAASLALYLNGVEQVPTTDYTISSATITYTVAPKSTDLMIAQYTH